MNAAQYKCTVQYLNNLTQITKQHLRLNHPCTHKLYKRTYAVHCHLWQPHKPDKTVISNKQMSSCFT